jgi:hypothetical protein
MHAPASTVERRITRGAIALATISALALLLTILINPVIARHDTPGPAVEPQVVAGNATCPADTTEIKFEADSGEIAAGITKMSTIGTTTVRVEILDTDGYSVAFDVDNSLAAHVLVKGGDNTNHYDYTVLAAGGIRHDDGLVAPTNAGGQLPTISHISFCLVLAAEESASADASMEESAEASVGEDEASLNIRKVNEDGARLAGAVFTVEGIPGTFTTAADGTFCILGLPDDSEWLVTEIEPPAGYELANPASQIVEVDDDGDCDSPDAVFVNTQSEESAEASVEESAEASVEESAEASVEESAEASVEESAEASVEESEEASPEGSVLGGTGTPAPSTPDTAMGGNGGPSPLPTIFFGAILLASLAGLAWVNVQAVRSRS